MRHEVVGSGLEQRPLRHPQTPALRARRMPYTAIATDLIALPSSALEPAPRRRRASRATVNLTPVATPA